jgi:hypothetical protein
MMQQYISWIPKSLINLTIFLRIWIRITVWITTQIIMLILFLWVGEIFQIIYLTFMTPLLLDSFMNVFYLLSKMYSKLLQHKTFIIMITSLFSQLNPLLMFAIIHNFVIWAKHWISIKILKNVVMICSESFNWSRGYTHYCISIT